MFSKNLNHIAWLLKRLYGCRLPAPYAVGKTALRDTLCDRLELSEFEAEQIVDSLEIRRLIRYQPSGAHQQGWQIKPFNYA